MMRPLPLLSLAVAITVAGCDSKDWADAGYQDGYAATINKICGFRATSIHGKFDNAEYANAYNRGSFAGSQAVTQRGCSNLK